MREQEVSQKGQITHEQDADVILCGVHTTASVISLCYRVHVQACTHRIMTNTEDDSEIPGV